MRKLPSHQRQVEKREVEHLDNLGGGDPRATS
jgi:hypothetical protein